MADPGCDACRTRQLGAVERIGEPERTEFMGGRAFQITQRYRCTHCSAVWVNRKEGGAGGRGNYWSVEEK